MSVRSSSSDFDSSSDRNDIDFLEVALPGAGTGGLLSRVVKGCSEQR